MLISRKKITASFVLLSLIVMVSGFLYGDVSMAKSVQFSTDQIGNSHCLEVGNGIEKNAPVSNNMMPCCLDRHDGSGTTLPTIVNEKINFENDSINQSFVDINLNNEKYLFNSSSGPPLVPDILSCLIKKE